MNSTDQGIESITMVTREISISFGYVHMIIWDKGFSQQMSFFQNCVTREVKVTDFHDDKYLFVDPSDQSPPPQRRKKKSKARSKHAFGLDSSISDVD